MEQLQVKRLNGNAKIPSKAHPGDAGYDIYALEGGILQPGNRCLVKTGIAMAVPNGYYIRIAPRSGLSLKNGMDVLAGVVDSGYRGEIGVILYNTSKTDAFLWDAGDAIAQCIIEIAKDFPVEVVSELSNSDRNTGGFGSTETRNL